MKSLLTLFTLVLTVGTMLGQSLIVSPEKPSPGDAITFTYDKSGTPLATEKAIQAIAYLCMDEGLPHAIEVDLTTDGANLKGNFATDEKTRAVFIVFKDAMTEEIIDNNADKGYKTKMYTADKSKVVKGTYATLANVYGSYGSIMEMQRDPAKGIKYFQKELKSYPESKVDVLGSYASMAQRNKDEAAIANAKELLEELKNKKKATEDDKMLAYRVSKSLKDDEGAEAIAEKLRKKYKKGQMIMNDDQQAFYKENDLSKKVALFDAFKKKYAKAEKLDNMLSSMAYRLVAAAGQNAKWDMFDTYLAYLTSSNQKASMLNNFAWGLSGEAVDKEAKDIVQAEKLSKLSLDLLKKEMEDLTANKPEYLTAKQWKKRLKGSYYMYADTYALTLYKQGKKEEALDYQEKVCSQAGFVGGEMYERLAVYMEGVKGGAATEAFLSEKIKENNATAAMKKQHRRLFLANNSIEQAYDKYLAGLEKEASAKFREELIAKMINDDAPDFRLLDLDGQEVSLDDMKGKVVILDFWATWCGPCKASFPGMQKMVDLYKDNDKVAFLFIDTWESAKDKEKAVSEFINKNEYTFQVLMDKKDEVVAKYKVEGIPTKFVLDGNGKIRFKSVGFAGNDEALMTEMNLMIELAGGKSGVDLSKADD
ncbi:MAG: TlpA family protein disulfide reductase [Saprospiraceae bacterium]|nr:TlpA family protein disulfide reductase [Saprospiraceae bacterium]